MDIMEVEVSIWSRRDRIHVGVLNLWVNCDRSHERVLRPQTGRVTRASYGEGSSWVNFTLQSVRLSPSLFIIPPNKTSTTKRNVTWYLRN